MGLGKFWIKHGPGSVGSIAKTVAKDFMRWKQELPEASKDELLRNTLLTRVASHSLLGLMPMSEDEQEDVLKNSDGKLTKLIQAIVHNENPAASETLMTAPQVYRTMLQVINEIVHKYAPDIE